MRRVSSHILQENQRDLDGSRPLVFHVSGSSGSGLAVCAAHKLKSSAKTLGMVEVCCLSILIQG